MRSAGPEKSNTKRNAVIASILGLVLIWRGAAVAGFLDEARKKSLPRRAAAGTETGESKPKSPATPEVAWPEFDLSKTVGHDPFSLDGVLLDRSRRKVDVAEAPAQQQVEKAVAESEAAFRQLIASNPVRGIVFGPNGPVAVLKSGTVRPGDHINEHVRVVSIDSGGIVVEMVDPFSDRASEDPAPLNDQGQIPQQPARARVKKSARKVDKPRNLDRI